MKKIFLQQLSILTPNLFALGKMETSMAKICKQVLIFFLRHAVAPPLPRGLAKLNVGPLFSDMRTLRSRADNVVGFDCELECRHAEDD